MLGIPALLNGAQVNTASILSISTAIQSFFKGVKTYGLYSQDTNLKVLEWDSCISFEYRNESSITDAPQEQGAFISYNKVASPFMIRTRATASTLSGRAQLLSDCETKLDSLTLYKFVTPEKVYRDVNLVNVSYHRSAEEGYALLAVDFVFREVRINQDSRYEQKPKEPSGCGQKSTGQVVIKN